jgi:hypothetical protein
MVKDIRDFFHINLNLLPDSSFINTGTEGSGNDIRTITWKKSLNPSVFQVFNSIEVQVFDKGMKHVFFKNDQLDKVAISDIRFLINSLFWFYGKDSRGKGLFTITDKMQFRSKNDYTLFGRSWTAGSNILVPVDLLINREKNLLSMNIWGIVDAKR